MYGCMDVWAAALALTWFGTLRTILGFDAHHASMSVISNLADPPAPLQVCLPQLGELSPSLIPQPEARAAFVWIIGQFGQHIQVCGKS